MIFWLFCSPKVMVKCFFCHAVIVYDFFVILDGMEGRTQRQQYRPVNYGDRRLKAASEMGFDKAVVPYSMHFEKASTVLLKRCQKVRDAFALKA